MYKSVRGKRKTRTFFLRNTRHSHVYNKQGPRQHRRGTTVETRVRSVPVRLRRVPNWKGAKETQSSSTLGMGRPDQPEAARARQSRRPFQTAAAAGGAPTTLGWLEARRTESVPLQTLRQSCTCRINLKKGPAHNIPAIFLCSAAANAVATAGCPRYNFRLLHTSIQGGQGCSRGACHSAWALASPSAFLLAGSAPDSSSSE